MGAYLSSPNCEKDTIQGSNDHLAFAASSMQGWRMSQEDAHNAILNYDDKTSFFAVYDGHGGAEIALYCSRHLPDFLKQLNAYRDGRLNEALTESFLKFDSLLLDSNVKEILQELADSKDRNDNDEEKEDDDDNYDDIQNKNSSNEFLSSKNSNEDNHHNDELNVEEAHLLRKEAELPIEELLKRYGENSQQINDDDQTKSSKKSKQVQDAEESNELDGTILTDQNQIKIDVVIHDNEETIFDQKIVETTTNGEIVDTIEPKPSSSEPKTTATRRTRKTISTEVTTKSKSLTHHLLSENLDELEDDDEEDEDDFEVEGSDDESSEEENDDDDDENNYEDVEDTEEEEEEEEKAIDPNNAVRIKKLMRKSIMAILNRSAKKNKTTDENEENTKENQDDDEQDDEQVEDDDEEDDDEDDGDIGKMLDMSSDPGSSSGCTAVVTLLRDKQLFVANAGDSRCVVCRDGRAIDMSIDHKPEDPQERTRIEKAGYKVTLDGRVSGGLNLSRAIGDHAYKKTSSLPAEEQAITALPDVRTLTLEDQDEFMVIACDGIWNFMSSQDVVDFVRFRLNKKSLSEICEELFMHCLAPNTSGDGTGCDNMTAIIVKFNFNSQLNQSVLSKPIEHSPWPTMFSNTNNKRSLSPEHTTTTNEDPDNNHSKKLKIISENGTNQESSTTENFSLNTSTNNVKNSNDDQQV